MSENETPVVATTTDSTPAIPEAPALEAAPVVAVPAAPVVAKKTTGKAKKSDVGRKKVALDAKRAGGFFMVDPDDVLIADDPGHPLYEAERNVLPLDPCFVKNIAKRGVKLPILIRKNGDRVVEVVDGRLRIRAAREVNKALREAGEKPMLVRAILEHGGDADLVAISGAAQIRTEESPLNKAKRAAKLVAYGYSTADIAIELGVSEKAVEQWLQIVDLSQSMQTAISLGHLSSTAALKFKHLSHEEQDAAVRSMTTTPAAQTTKTDADNEQTPAEQAAKPAKVKRVTEREARAAAGGIVKPGLKAIKKVRSGLIGQAVFVVAWMLGEIDARELVHQVPSAKAGLEAAGLLVGDDKGGPGAKAKKGKKAKKGPAKKGPAKKGPAKKGPAKKTTGATLDDAVASVTGKVLAGLGLK
jgi:ParB family transcriptional regulator, chromosome partitioning protein